MHRAASSLSSLWLFHVAVWGGMNWGEFPLLPSSTERSSEQLLPCAVVPPAVMECPELQGTLRDH